MSLRHIPIDALQLDDEASFRHVALYGRLKEHLAHTGAVYAIAEGGSEHDARLLNLAFWHPGQVVEVLPDAFLAADQLAHGAWHVAGQRALGDEAATRRGMLFIEAVASACDVYLVGRLLGHAPESSFLESQVPAMADACAAAELDESGFEALLESMSREPEGAFDAVRRLLFAVATELVTAEDADAAAAVLARHRERPFGPLLHHYELPTWVLYARAYGRDAPTPQTDALIAELDSVGDGLQLLADRWLASAQTP